MLYICTHMVAVVVKGLILLPDSWQMTSVDDRKCSGGAPMTSQLVVSSSRRLDRT